MALSKYTSDDARAIRISLKRLRIAVDELALLLRGPGRPYAKKPKVDESEFTFTEVSEWLKPSFFSEIQAQIPRAAAQKLTKRVLVMLLCQEGPFKPRDLVDRLAIRYAVRLSASTVSHALFQLRKDGLVRLRQGAWENYWVNHPQNEKTDGVWAEPVRWTPES